MPAWARACGGLLCVLHLVGCAATGDFSRSLSEVEQDLPRQADLVDVPFFPQERYQCGPAALATVLTYYGVDTDPDALKPLVYLPARNGSIQTEVVATGRSFGMLAYVIEPDFGALLREVAAGYPVLVLQNLGFAWFPRWHYAVVVAYDMDEAQLTLRSGTTEHWSTSFRAFDNTWARAARWAVVFAPPGEMPATAQPLPYLNHALELEQTGQSDAALQAYENAMATWPDHLLPAMALGNLTYALGRLDAAEASFRHAVERHPRVSAAWNNLGHVLAARRCGAPARQALACAARLSPDEALDVEAPTDLVRADEPGECRAQPLPACP